MFYQKLDKNTCKDGVIIISIIIIIIIIVNN